MIPAQGFAGFQTNASKAEVRMEQNDKVTEFNGFEAGWVQVTAE